MKFYILSYLKVERWVEKKIFQLTLNVAFPKSQQKSQNLAGAGHAFPKILLFIKHSITYIGK